MADTPQIFISYSGADAAFGKAVAGALHEQGVEHWDSAEPQLSAGTPWLDQVADALAASDVVVVFVGGAIKSPWLLFEIGVAVGGGKRVVPVYMTEGAIQVAPSPLSMFQGIDAHDQTPEKVARQIVRAISAPV